MNNALPQAQVDESPTVADSSLMRTRQVQQARHRLVQRASAFLRDHMADSVRIADLSRVAGVSERALRNAFRREHGVSPKQFDIRQRLNDARRALCDAAAPSTVTSVATHFGFFELGRFARLYKDVFGESPSDTIRSRARRHDSRQAFDPRRDVSARTSAAF